MALTLESECLGSNVDSAMISCGWWVSSWSLGDSAHLPMRIVRGKSTSPKDQIWHCVWNYFVFLQTSSKHTLLLFLFFLQVPAKSTVWDVMFHKLLIQNQPGCLAEWVWKRLSFNTHGCAELHHYLKPWPLLTLHPYGHDFKGQFLSLRSRFELRG